MQLSQPNVIEGSVVVTSLDRTITYTAAPDPDADYVLTTIGAFTFIARVLPTTDIPDGGSVLVTFLIDAPRDATWHNEPLTWNNRLKIRNTPFGVYYNFQKLDQELVKGFDPGTLNSTSSHLFGVDLDWQGLTAAAEHEIRDQQLSPNHAHRPGPGRVQPADRQQRRPEFGRQRQPAWSTRTAGSSGWSPGRDFLDTTGLFARLNTRLNSNTMFNVGVESTRDRGQQNDDLTRFIAQLLWRYRQLEFSVEARQSFYTRETTTGNESVLMFRVSRKF